MFVKVYRLFDFPIFVNLFTDLHRKSYKVSKFSYVIYKFHKPKHNLPIQIVHTTNKDHVMDDENFILHL